MPGIASGEGRPNMGVIDALDALFTASWFPYTLLSMGLLATLMLGFPQLKLFPRGFAILFGKRKVGKGDTSPLQALSAALSGTIGTGNIGGVGLAIFIGGPGALFWMWVTAALGMALKMVEVVLSHRHREFLPSGEVCGGPMYVLDKALNLRWLAVAFAVLTVLCTIGTGNMVQSNNIAESVRDALSIPEWFTGVLLAIVLGLVIMGGIRAIARMAEALVPTMALLYLGSTSAIIVINYDNILSSFAWIFEAVFSGAAAYGGFLGATFAMGFERGVQRGIFSNEAGQGSASIAHATSDTESPVEEGIVALIEPFIDTLVICTFTGLAILASGVWHQKYDNMVDRADIRWLEGRWEEGNPQHSQALVRFLAGDQDQGAQGESGALRARAFSGQLQVQDGRLVGNPDVTLLAAYSLPENARFFTSDLTDQATPYTGPMQIDNGLQPLGVRVRAETRVHSVTLTNRAFASVFGDWGKYLVTVCLIMFAFTSAVTWAYYGTRAWIWLFGQSTEWIYKVIYVTAFFLATVIDTTVVWKLANIVTVMMALPNLLACLLLLRKVRQWTREFMDGDGQRLVQEIAAEQEGASAGGAQS